MPKLYVANATQQVHQFTFTLPEVTRSMIQEIPIGGQVLVAGRELPSTSIDAIIEQKSRYGLVSLADALRTSRAPFHGFAYQLDKPIPASKIFELSDRYNSVLNTRGRELRAEAAVATEQFIQDHMFRQQVPGRLANLEQTVEEVNRDQRDETPEISDGVRVVRDQPGAERPALRRGRRTRDS